MKKTIFFRAVAARPFMVGPSLSSGENVLNWPLFSFLCPQHHSIGLTLRHYLTKIEREGTMSAFRRGRVGHSGLDV